MSKLPGHPVSYGALVCALMAADPLVGLAQAQDKATNALIEEITVTATKKANAEDVQDVPVAVTAFGERQLNALNVRDLRNLTTAIPNVSLDDVGTTPGTANFSVRGLGINSSIPSIDPTVGVFVDGVYLGVNNGIIFDLFDLESIEVLRGPQGILFGRNVTGGAVLINTKKASSEFEATVRGAVESGLRGTGENFYIMGAVGGPVTDTLSARLSVYYNDDQGYFNRFLGGSAPFDLATAQFTEAGAAILAPDGPAEDEFVNHGARETFMVRPSLYWTPTETFSLSLKFEHGELEGDGPSAQNHTNGFGVTNPFFSASRDSFDFSIDEPGLVDTEWDQLTAEATLDVGFGDGTITNIFGWRQLTQQSISDIDATPLFFFHAGTATDQDQISNEIRYNGTFGEIFDVTAGFYYFSQDIAYTETRTVPPQALVGNSPFFSGGGVQDQETIGIFGNVDISVTEKVTVNLGARWTDETKEVVISNLLFTRTNPFCDVLVAGSCSEDFADEGSWSNFNPKIGVEYRHSDNLNMYAHWTQGVRSGGYNFRSASLAFAPGPFDEETVNAFELGFKAQPFDGRAIFNVAFFYNDIEDMQREVLLPDPVVGSVQIVQNTADARILGFEAEATIFLTDDLVFIGSVGHTDGDYQDILFDLNGDAVIDDADSDLQIPRLAPWTFSAGLVHSMAIGDETSLDTRVNFSRRDRSFFTDDNRGVLNAIDVLDASVAVNIRDNITFSVFGRNLLDEVNFGGDAQLPTSIGGGTFSPLARGRVFGIDLTYNF